MHIYRVRRRRGMKLISALLVFPDNPEDDAKIDSVLGGDKEEYWIKIRRNKKASEKANEREGVLEA